MKLLYAGTIWEQKQGSKLTALALCCALLAACALDPNSLRGGIDAISPAVEYAITKGLIDRTKADLYRTDAKKLIDGYEVLSTEWKAAGSDKAAKVIAVGHFANNYAAPVTRDFTNIPALSEAMLILNTSLAVLQAFYGGHAAPGATANMPKSEGELKAFLKEQDRKMRAALAH
jgi:hypothetical protein